MNFCEKCKSEFKPNTRNVCLVCEQVDLHGKIVSVPVQLYEYSVILDALEFAFGKFKDGEKKKEFKHVLSIWNKFSKNFETESINHDDQKLC